MEEEEELEEIEGSAGKAEYASQIDMLDEKVKAQARIWRLDGVPARQIVKRLKLKHKIDVSDETIWNWITREKFTRSDVAESLLKQIHLLRMKIDNALVLEVPNQRLQQYLNTLETYARVYREIPKEGKRKKGAKDIYDALG